MMNSLHLAATQPSCFVKRTIALDGKSVGSFPRRVWIGNLKESQKQFRSFFVLQRKQSIYPLETLSFTWIRPISAKNGGCTGLKEIPSGKIVDIGREESIKLTENEGDALPEFCRAPFWRCPMTPIGPQYPVDAIFSNIPDEIFELNNSHFPNILNGMPDTYRKIPTDEHINCTKLWSLKSLSKQCWMAS